ncbi:hypothetical protein TWF730_004461 [Orbilia blumenaviensis]|uniref:Cytochrome P450 n=1 Tax=Orbilia blumenaviensis TaxID=1796055 RepID=A0AAV9TYS3_9PEZI
MFVPEDLLANGPLLYGSLVLGSILFIQRIISALKAPRKLPLPPGPRGLPFVGNINDLPPPGTVEWHHWVKHKEIYGPISSVTAFGRTIVILHNKELAVELLEKRSAKFSSRPSFHFASEMIGYKHMLGLVGYNDSLRIQRRMAAKQMGSKNSITRFFSSMDFQVRQFLLRTMSCPSKLDDNLKFETASFVLDMLFGYQTDPSGKDPLVDLVGKWMAEFNISILNGAWLVDLIPWLEYLPEWLPGMGFKATARRFRKNYVDVQNIPYEFSKARKEEGSNKPSYVAGLLDGNPDDAEIKEIKYSATALYGGGTDTSAASLRVFFLNMSLNPEIQKKAQEEIDRVVGPDRLPGFEDRPNLPYVEAILTETLRWMPIVPLGLPHASDEEEEFRGYRIPKGSIIVPSIGGFARDPENYPEPEKFIPERFLGPNKQLDPHSYVFGFGRRVCPGRHLSDANMFITIAKSLAAFNISKAIDSDGNEIEPAIEEQIGTIAQPKPFQCTIKPRNEKYRELVTQVELECPLEKGDAEFIGIKAGGQA